MFALLPFVALTRVAALSMLPPLSLQEPSHDLA